MGPYSETSKTYYISNFISRAVWWYSLHDHVAYLFNKYFLRNASLQTTTVHQHNRPYDISAIWPDSFVFWGLDNRCASWYPAQMSYLKQGPVNHVQGPLTYTQESQKSIFEDSLSNQVTWDGVFLQTFSRLNVPEAHGVITRARAQLWAIYKMNKTTLQDGIWDFVVKACYCLRVCSPGPTAIPLTTSSWPQNSWTGSVSRPKSHISTVLSRDALKIKELPLKQHN